MLSNQLCSLLQISHRVLLIAAAQRGRTDNQRAIRHRLRQGFEFLSLREQRCGSHGGTRFAKGQFEQIHHTQMQKAKVAHRACSGANIQRIPRVHQHHAQPFECVLSGQVIFGQGLIIYINLHQRSLRESRVEMVLSHNRLNALSGRKVATKARANIDCPRVELLRLLTWPCVPALKRPVGMADSISLHDLALRGALR